MNNLSAALRNSLVIRWLRAQRPELLALIRENYAAFLKCPFDETVKFDGSEGLDTNCLVWVHSQFPIDIKEFATIGKGNT